MNCDTNALCRLIECEMRERLPSNAQHTVLGSHIQCVQAHKSTSSIYLSLLSISCYNWLSSSSFEINCSFLLWEKNQLEKNAANWCLSWRSGVEEKQHKTHTHTWAYKQPNSERDSRNCFLITHQKKSCAWRNGIALEMGEALFKSSFFIHKNSCVFLCHRSRESIDSSSIGCDFGIFGW